jgi:hypothetical protein
MTREMGRGSLPLWLVGCRVVSNGNWFLGCPAKLSGRDWGGVSRMCRLSACRFTSLALEQRALNTSYSVLPILAFEACVVGSALNKLCL